MLYSKFSKLQQILYRKRISMLWAGRDHLIQGTFSSSASIIIVLPRHVVSIVRIINIIINMDNIKQERPNKSPILKLNKRLKKRLPTRNLAHMSRYLWYFRSSKNKQCSIRRSKIISGKPPLRSTKMECFQTFKSPNSKMWNHIHKIFDIQSETSLLISYGKVSSLSTEKWGSP